MLKGYKTIMFNVLASLVPIMELTELRDVIPQDYLPLYMLVVAIGNVWLRSVTTTSVGKGG